MNSDWAKSLIPNLNITKLNLKEVIGKGSRGGKKDQGEINICRTKDFKFILPSALKDFYADLCAIPLTP